MHERTCKCSDGEGHIEDDTLFNYCIRLLVERHFLLNKYSQTYHTILKCLLNIIGRSRTWHFLNGALQCTN